MSRSFYSAGTVIGARYRVTVVVQVSDLGGRRRARVCCLRGPR